MKKILLLILISAFGFDAFSQKISEMTPATTVSPSALLPIVQGGANYSATVSKLPFTDSVKVSNDSLYHRRLGTWRFVYKLSSSEGGASTLTGDVTGTGSGTINTTIATASVTNAKLANMAGNTIKGNNTGGGNVPVDLTSSQVKTMLSLNNVDNTPDVSKPVSTAQQTALDGKAALFHNHAGTDITSGTVAAARLGSGTANSSTVLHGDNVWRTPSGGGTGDVVGPSSATDNGIARFDLTTGKLLQNSAVTITDGTEPNVFIPGGSFGDNYISFDWNNPSQGTAWTRIHKNGRYEVHYGNLELESSEGITLNSYSAKVKVSNLSGTGTRMVVTDSVGRLSTQAIPSGGSGSIDTNSLSRRIDTLANRINGKQATLGFTPENTANKVTNLSSPNNTTYPSSQAVANAIAAISGGGLSVLPASAYTFKNRGEKIRGCNVVPDFTRHAGAWELMWMDGEWDNDTAYCWVNVVKRQIDLAKGLGANAVHMKGSYGTFETVGICSGTNPTPPWHWDVQRFIRNQRHLLKYLASQGMYYYLGLSGVESYLYANKADACNITYNDLLTQDSVVLTELDRHKGVVVGIDLLNEASLWLDDSRSELNIVSQDTFIAVLQRKYNWAKRFTSIPLTYSICHRGGGTQDENLFKNPIVAALSPYCDFFDFHPYYTGNKTPKREDLDTVLSAYDKYIWFGEYGGFISDSSMRGKNARGVRDIVNQMPEVEAAYMFEVLPHGSGYEDYGMYAMDGTPRLDVITPFMQTRQRADQPYTIRVDLGSDKYLPQDYGLLDTFILIYRNDRPLMVTVEYDLDINAGAGHTVRVASFNDFAFTPPFGGVSGGESGNRQQVKIKNSFIAMPGIHSYRPALGVIEGTASIDDVIYGTGASSITITYYPLN